MGFDVFARGLIHPGVFREALLCPCIIPASGIPSIHRLLPNASLLYTAKS